LYFISLFVYAYKEKSAFFTLCNYWFPVYKEESHLRPQINKIWRKLGAGRTGALSN
jgi:hypothetical protein